MTLTIKQPSPISHDRTLMLYCTETTFSFPGFKNTYLKSTDKAQLNPVTGKLSAKALHNAYQPLLNTGKTWEGRVTPVIMRKVIAWPGLSVDGVILEIWNLDKQSRCPGEITETNSCRSCDSASFTKTIH